MPTDEQRKREQFDKWARTEGMRMRLDRELGRYMHPETEGAWRAFRSRDAEVQALREVLTEVTNELEAEVNHRYGFDPATGEVKGLARRYEVDISVVRMARAVLAGEEATDEWEAVE